MIILIAGQSYSATSPDRHLANVDLKLAQASRHRFKITRLGSKAFHLRSIFGRDGTKTVDRFQSTYGEWCEAREKVVRCRERMEGVWLTWIERNHQATEVQSAQVMRSGRSELQDAG